MSDGSSASEKKDGGGNSRPANIQDLMLHGAIDRRWTAVNRDKNRFFVTNLDPVITDLGLQHTNAGDLFKKATLAVLNETAWVKQSGFDPADFGCSKTQIYPKDRGNAKLFGRTVTIVMALDLFNSELPANRRINVYDQLRILPAQYFVDKFDDKRFVALSEWYDALAESVRHQKFGERAPPTFAEAAILHLGQHETHLLQEMTVGHTVSKYVADKFVDFVRAKCPDDLHLGPVKIAGEEPHDPRTLLGTRAAAPALRVPKEFKPSEIPAMGAVQDASGDAPIQGASEEEAKGGQS